MYSNVDGPRDLMERRPANYVGNPADLHAADIFAHDVRCAGNLKSARLAPGDVGDPTNLQTANVFADDVCDAADLQTTDVFSLDVGEPTNF